MKVIGKLYTTKGRRNVQDSGGKGTWAKVNWNTILRNLDDDKYDVYKACLAIYLLCLQENESGLGGYIH